MLQSSLNFDNTVMEVIREINDEARNRINRIFIENSRSKLV